MNIGLVVLCVLILIDIISTLVYTFYNSSQLSDKLDLLHKEKEDFDKQQEIDNFTPYLALITQTAEVKDKNGNNIGIQIPEFSFQTIVYEEGDLCQLLSGIGYISKEDLTSNFERDVNVFVATVRENTFLKNGPSQGFHNIRTIFKGEIVEVYEIYGNWRRIKTQNSEGYILNSLLEKKEKVKNS